GVRGMKDDGEETKIAGDRGARRRASGAARRSGVEVDDRRVRLRPVEGLHRAAQRGHPGGEPHRGDEERGGERLEPARRRGSAAYWDHGCQGRGLGLPDLSRDPPPQRLPVRGGEGAGAEARVGEAVEVEEQGGALPAGQEVVLKPPRLGFPQLAGVIGRERLRLRVCLCHAPSSMRVIEPSKYGPSSSWRRRRARARCTFTVSGDSRRTTAISLYAISWSTRRTRHFRICSGRRSMACRRTSAR